MSQEDVSVAIPCISIDLVRAALRSEEFRGVARETLELDARNYARFLMLAAVHPNTALAPTRAIDRMWHLHMLHPRAYVADCMRIFGDILDHDGGFGASSDEAPILARVFERTELLWRAAFGDSYRGEATKCTRNCVSRCRRACKTLV
jgi:hypothetical protein